MIITLTGTPGTGKTTIARKMADEYNVVHLTDFLEEHGIGEEVEGEREVPIQEMINKIQEIELTEDTLIEGHLAYHIESDICVVLRCRPDELEKRLSERSYSEQKIKENVEAETLDVILSEAVQKQETVIEIDTTNKNMSETMNEIEEKMRRGESSYGNVDWTEFL